MSGCPYTWFKNVFAKKTNANSSDANHLRVSVMKQNQIVVDVALPAKSARWLIDLIPDDVLLTIKQEGIPIEDIQKNLSVSEKLCPQEIFSLKEQHRQVNVWLE